MQAGDVLDVLLVLDEAAIEPILDGGWGIDALLGAQHRDHDDLDLVVPVGKVDKIIAALGEVGFAIVEDVRPTRVALADRSGRAVDLHLVRTDEHGDRWQPGGRPDGGECKYGGTQVTHGWVGGQPVRCIDAVLQVEHHAGYAPRERDRHDLGLLRDRFGITLPPGY